MSAFADIIRLLDYSFFQNALLGGAIAAVACSIVGLFLILRKESMIGDGVAHTAFGGIAIGLYIGVYPVFTALIVSVISVLGISYMKKKGYAQSDSAIAVILALGFSIGLVIISLAGGFNVELFSYLFGSILTINYTDLAVVTILAAISLTFVGVFYKELLAMTFDEESARLVGIPVGAFSTIFNVLVAVTIVLSIKIIGIILVVALLVLPGLAALQLKMSFKGTATSAILLGVTSVLFGILFSALYRVSASGIIIFTAAGVFLVAAAYGRYKHG